MNTIEREVIEAVGEAMEDWAFRMHGTASSHRPGKDNDGIEARLIIEPIERLLKRPLITTSLGGS